MTPSTLIMRPLMDPPVVPDNVQTYLNRAGLAYQKRSFDEVEHFLLKALQLESENPDILQNLGALRDQLRDFEAAAGYYHRALNAAPERNDIRRGLASLYFEQGEHDESRQLYESLIQRDPNDIDAYFAFSRLTNFQQNDQVFNSLRKASEYASTLSFDQRVKLDFVLGKAYQDRGDYDLAYDAFTRANSIHYERYPFDEKSHFALLADLKRNLDKQYFAENPTTNSRDNSPIFVLGMPRSGSTLVEQILASHGDISGGGELKYLKACIHKYLIGDKKTIANALPHVTRKNLTDAAANYMQNLNQHANDNSFVVDKMPGNFAFIGFIAQLFPGAKIVHTTRHPMAVFWSNYSTHFSDALYFSYQPEVLCRYMEEYRDIMDHWQSVLPKNAFYDIKYEQLVQNPEAEIRGLLGYLGLPWNDACLEFHQTKREVKTASVAQVRRPLYATAVDLWQNYSEQLEPYSKRLEERF